MEPDPPPPDRPWPTSLALDPAAAPTPVIPWVGYASLSPLPASIPPEVRRFDALAIADAAFLRRLLELDAQVFGPRGQAMPSWVLFDCALAPGLVLGFATRRAALPDEIGAAFSCAPDALVPISMMSLLPLPDRRRQLVHTLGWIGGEAEGGLSLGRATVRLATTLLGAASSGRLRCVAGWSSPELALFAELGPLALVAAWTPAHDTLATATVDLDPQGPGRLAESFVAGSALSSSPTRDELELLQARIERGERLYLGLDPGASRRWVVATVSEGTP